jgi:hypothetical protein
MEFLAELDLADITTRPSEKEGAEVTSALIARECGCRDATELFGDARVMMNLLFGFRAAVEEILEVVRPRLSLMPWPAVCG